MKFRRCKECNKYKYIEFNQKCRTCVEKDTVYIIVDIFSGEVKEPSSLKKISDAMDSVKKVRCAGTKKHLSGTKDDDIDIKSRGCRLYEAGVENLFDNYSGERSVRIGKSVRDTLIEARRIYG